MTEAALEVAGAGVPPDGVQSSDEELSRIADALESSQVSVRLRLRLCAHLFALGSASMLIIKPCLH